MPLAPQVESFYLTFGDRVAKLRAQHRWSQEELGNKLTPPMSRASIANIETGKQRVLAHTIAQLAHVLSVPVAWLFEDAVAPDHQVSGSQDSMQILEADLRAAMQELSEQQAHRLANDLWHARQP